MATDQTTTPLDLDAIRARADGFVENPFMLDHRVLQLAQVDVPALIREVERLNTWAGLMSLVDRHYPTDVWPAGEDRPDADPGARILSLPRRAGSPRRAGGRLPEDPGPGSGGRPDRLLGELVQPIERARQTPIP